MPSPIEDRPGLLMRDSFRFSDATLVIPPPLVPVLDLFNGHSTELDLREALTRITGELTVGGLAQHLITTLDEAAFLDNATYAQRKQDKYREIGRAHV